MASHEKEQASSSSRIKYKKFMGKYQAKFIDSVDAGKIAPDLQLEEIIPDRNAYASSKESVRELYFHMLEQGTVKSLRKLYSICKQYKGYPQMNDFGNDMLERLDEEITVDDCKREDNKREDNKREDNKREDNKREDNKREDNKREDNKREDNKREDNKKEDNKREDDEREDDSAGETVEPPPKKPAVDKPTSPTVKAITSPSKGSCSTELEKEEPPRKQLGGEKIEPIGRVLSVVEFRHVVLLGKSGVGKSTVGNRILGLGTNNRPPGFEAGVSWDQVTRGIHTVPVERVFNGRTLRISVTDTIGLFNKKMGQGVMTKVREHVQKHCRDGITTVLFVLSKERFLAVEQEVYDCIMKHCDTEDAKSMTALVLTSCEDMDDKQKANYRESFKTGMYTKKLVDFVKLGIHLVGFPDFSKYGESSRQLEEMFRDSIRADTDHLLKIVAENNKPKMVQEIMLKSWWEKCALF